MTIDERIQILRFVPRNYLVDHSLSITCHLVKKGMIRVRNDCMFPVRIIVCPERNQVCTVAKNMNFNIGAGINNLNLGYGKGEENVVARTGIPQMSEVVSANSAKDLNIPQSSDIFVTITDMQGMTLGVIDKHVCQRQTLLLSPVTVTVTVDLISATRPTSQSEAASHQVSGRLCGC
jgi:hypothetical protein